MLRQFFCTLCLVFFPFFVCGNEIVDKCDEYKYYIESCGFEENTNGYKVFFILSNNLIVTWNAPINEGHKVFNINKYEGMEVRFSAPLRIPEIKMSVYRKNSWMIHEEFSIGFQYESLDNLPCLDEKNIDLGFFWCNGIITLSDGSTWEIKDSDDCRTVYRNWVKGDKVIVTKLQWGNDYLLINLNQPCIDPNWIWSKTPPPDSRIVKMKALN